MPHESRRCEHGIDTLRDCPDCENGFALALDEEVKRLRDEAKSLRTQLATAKKDNPRCEDCGNELTDCGPMSIDGPTADCPLCKARERADGANAENARLGRELEEARARADRLRAECLAWRAWEIEEAKIGGDDETDINANNAWSFVELARSACDTHNDLNTGGVSNAPTKEGAD